MKKAGNWASTSASPSPTGTGCDLTVISPHLKLEADWFTWLPRVYRRYGDALLLSITLVPGKAYTAAVTRCTTKEVAAAAAEGAPLMGIQTADPRITLVAGGYPLFADGKIVGAIGVGGGTEAQDCEIAEHVVRVFEAAE